MLLEVEMLTDRIVARDERRADTGGVEWPPDPDRVFMALVAAWGSLDAAGRAKAEPFLRWLERERPAIAYGPLPDQKIQPMIHYVPLNSMKHVKSPKGKPFKATYVEGHLGWGILDDRIVRYRYPDPPPDIDHEAVQDLLRYVTCVGASESLAAIRLAETADESMEGRVEIVPLDGGRVFVTLPGAGRLDDLEANFRNRTKRIEGLIAPVPPGQVAAYGSPRDREAEKACFTGLVPLSISGIDVSIVHGPSVVEAIRGAFLNKVRGTSANVPIVTGHLPDMGDFRDLHVGYAPLGEVGHRHAGGRLHGVALLLPKNLEDPSMADAREAAIDAWKSIGTFNWRGLEVQTKPLSLLREDERKKFAFQRDRWMGPWHGSTCWTTVTPVVFNVPARGTGDRSVMTLVEKMCKEASIPAKVVSVRHQRGPILRGTSAAGDARELHLEITFDQPIRGPIAIGRGRFKGRGFFLPDAVKA